MKKHFTYKSKRQLWRILISDSDKLLLETRDTETKEVFFQCYSLVSGEENFTSLQLEEKHWLGIEAIYKDIIYFHKFPKPDLPQHKGIIAFDIASQKILWANADYSFQFIYNDRVYCFAQGFEERNYYALNYLTGELAENLGNNYLMINQLKAESNRNGNWDAYIYPNRLSENGNTMIRKLIDSKTEKLQLAGEIEFNLFQNLLMFNFHEQIADGNYTNRFFMLNQDSAETIIEEVLNEKATNLFTDSFFVYKDYLFLLKGKNEIVIYNLN